MDWKARAGYRKDYIPMKARASVQCDQTCGELIGGSNGQQGKSFLSEQVYVSLVEHPARMECGAEIATAQFPPSYRRGTIMQVTLAAVCLLSSLLACRGNILVGRGRRPVGQCHPVHAGRDAAHQ